jgi:hypothetical protein
MDDEKKMKRGTSPVTACMHKLLHHAVDQPWPQNVDQMHASTLVARLIRMMVSGVLSWSTTIQASTCVFSFTYPAGKGFLVHHGMPYSMELVASTAIFVTSHLEDASRGVK